MVWVCVSCFDISVEPPPASAPLSEALTPIYLILVLTFRFLDGLLVQVSDVRCFFWVAAKEFSLGKTSEIWICSRSYGFWIMATYLELLNSKPVFGAWSQLLSGGLGTEV